MRRTSGRSSAGTASTTRCTRCAVDIYDASWNVALGRFCRLTASCAFTSQMQMREDQKCKVTCKLEALNQKQTKDFQSRIDDEYRTTL